MSATLTRHEALIAGRWRGGVGDAWLDVFDPADRRSAIGQVPALSALDLNLAFEGIADAAFEWRTVNALARGAVLLRAAQLLRDQQEEIAAELVAEVGKTSAEARGEVGKAAEFFEFYASVARLPFGYLLHDARPSTSTSVRLEPVGAVVAITPWNDPLLTPARKLAPALATGNAVVLKPATETPLIALRLARILLDAGLLPSALTVLTGRGSELSEPLLAQPAIAAVTFTGSTEVGRDIQQRLAGRQVRVQTEMGGKNAAVVLADCDLDLAARTIGAAAFGQGGQRCTATSRVIVERSVASRLVDRLVAHATSLRLGPGRDERTTLGPLVNERHRDEVVQHVRAAVGEGAIVRAGGDAPKDDSLQNGCYVEPTILTGVTREMRIWSDEVFGPVIAVHEVDGFEEALEATNDSVYGLSASLFTESLEKANRFLDVVEAGQAAVNLPTSGWDVHHPFGGFRDSGSPFKEQGLESLRFYTRIKTCAVGFSAR